MVQNIALTDSVVSECKTLFFKNNKNSKFSLDNLNEAVNVETEKMYKGLYLIKQLLNDIQRRNEACERFKLGLNKNARNVNVIDGIFLKLMDKIQTGKQSANIKNNTDTENLNQADDFKALSLDEIKSIIAQSAMINSDTNLSNDVFQFVQEQITELTDTLKLADAQTIDIVYNDIDEKLTDIIDVLKNNKIPDKDKILFLSKKIKEALQLLNANGVSMEKSVNASMPQDYGFNFSNSESKIFSNKEAFKNYEKVFQITLKENL